MPDEAVKYPNMVDYRKRMDGKRKGSLGVAGDLWGDILKMRYYGTKNTFDYGITWFWAWRMLQCAK